MKGRGTSMQDELIQALEDLMNLYGNEAGRYIDSKKQEEANRIWQQAFNALANLVYSRNPRSTEGIVDRYLELQDELNSAELKLGLLFEETGARKLDSSNPKISVKQTIKTDYNREVFRPLLEILSKDEVNKFYTESYVKHIPARNETVPEKWNVAELKPIAKDHGFKVLKYLDDARMEQITGYETVYEGGK
jgi:hypothetical protein